jgi:hypothetical protein
MHGVMGSNSKPNMFSWEEVNFDGKFKSIGEAYPVPPLDETQHLYAVAIAPR